MALFNRRRHEDEPVDHDRTMVEEPRTDDDRATHERPADDDRPTHERPADRHRYKRGMARGLFTLVGVAVAGLLTWIAADSFAPADGTSDFWVAMGLIAAVGLALGLSQLFGGWTKWGVPRISSGVFLFGWIPTAIAVGWILMTIQPEGGWQQSRLEDWSDSIGILGFVESFAEFAAVPALVLGLVTAFVFDTAGPRRKVNETDYDRHERRVPDEDVHDYRREDTSVTTGARKHEPVGSGTRTGDSERTVETRPTRRDTP